ncbi:TPA: glycosyl transferase [Proteus mirabilis]|nr:glycosyl transferase [Proteus mirabilis]
MIPKKIHYVWVGKAPKSDLVKNCITTWKEKLPDYEFIEWNEQCISEINCSYLSEAYSNEKWAFVSDVIRLYALYINGGIYLDTDVEVIDSFDEFLTLDFFSCHKYHEGNCWPITSAVMGACKENHIIKDLLELYMTLRFETKEGLDLTANTQRITEYFKTKFSLSPPFYENNTLNLTKNEIIFPAYYFCCPKVGYHGFSIHHFSGSWLPSHSRKEKLSFFKRFKLLRLIKLRETGNFPLTRSEKIILQVSLKGKIYMLIKNTL